jgi:hypothetical protein
VHRRREFNDRFSDVCCEILSDRFNSKSLVGQIERRRLGQSDADEKE